MLNFYWLLPLVGLLLSIALFPVLQKDAWHRHQGKIAIFWLLTFLLPFAFLLGVITAGELLFHIILLEYIPFIVLLFALYTTSSGILIEGNLQGHPRINTMILGLGTLLASVMGTTGATVLLIRPLLRANQNRTYNQHVAIFFIFLVANIGGGLTPLGDPPLFLGFLLGVDFLWTLRAMGLPVLFVSCLLLFSFFILDCYFWKKEDLDLKKVACSLRIQGAWNFLFTVLIISLILSSARWNLGTVLIWGTSLPIQSLIRDSLLLLIGIASIKWTSSDIHKSNAFDWGPIKEVAKLFFAIFIVISPAISILRAGKDGQLADLFLLVTNRQGEPINILYFWICGLLSSFLDNAPTYLVFFNLAGGDATQLMGPLSKTLLAISMGSVFMGATTYIGNAPNLMVKAIAEHRGIVMPSFFGFIAWSAVILFPVMALTGFIFL